MECLEDDLGLSLPRDASEVLRRLRLQGVDAVAVAGAGGPPAEAPRPKASWAQAYVCRVDTPRTGRGDAAAATWIFRGNGAAATPPRRRGRSAETGARLRYGSETPGVAISTENALTELRQHLKRRGVRGITDLARGFRVADKDRSGRLSLSEFARCCKRANV